MKTDYDFHEWKRRWEKNANHKEKYYCLNEGEPVCRCGNCEEIPTYLEEK